MTVTRKPPRKVQTLNSRQLRAIIEQLGLTHVEFAELVGAEPRSSLRWISDDRKISPAVSILARLLQRGKLDRLDVLAAHRQEPRRRGEPWQSKDAEQADSA